MNVVRSFYHTFHIFPIVLSMDMFFHPVTTPKVRFWMTSTVVGTCLTVNYLTDNPLLAMVLAFLMPEFLIRAFLACICPLSHTNVVS